jgi:hypothetical protein
MLNSHWMLLYAKIYKAIISCIIRTLAIMQRISLTHVPLLLRQLFHIHGIHAAVGSTVVYPDDLSACNHCARSRNSGTCSIWFDCDKPKNDAIADVMRRTRAANHCAISGAKQDEQSTMRERLNMALLNKGGRNFWAHASQLMMLSAVNIE